MVCRINASEGANICSGHHVMSRRLQGQVRLRRWGSIEDSDMLFCDLLFFNTAFGCSLGGGIGLVLVAMYLSPHMDIIIMNQETRNWHHLMQRYMTGTQLMLALQSKEEVNITLGPLGGGGGPKGTPPLPNIFIHYTIIVSDKITIIFTTALK